MHVELSKCKGGGERQKTAIRSIKVEFQRCTWRAVLKCSAGSHQVGELMVNAARSSLADIWGSIRSTGSPDGPRGDHHTDQANETPCGPTIRVSESDPKNEESTANV